MSGALKQLQPRLGNHPVVADRGLDWNHAVLQAPDDQGRDLDLGQSVAGVVAADGLGCIGEAGASNARVYLLLEQLWPDSVRVVEDVAEGELAAASPG